jgi:predicted alpha/beta superfamily hydrolase
MNLKQTSIILLSLFTMNVAYSQEPKTDNIQGSNYVFYSEITGEDQHLQVYLPENYTENTTIKYPVLYLLDGQNWYTSAVSLSKVFTGTETNYKSIPDFIVVGIKTNWKKRREFFGANNKKNAINFIENEVIAFIDENFRTSTERILFGWQFAGGFVINTLAEKPKLFNAYLAATPVFFDPNVVDTLLSEHKNLNSFLYVAGTKEEESTWVKPMVNILTEKAPKNFDWTYKEISAFGAFGHRISPIETISYGLRAYFHDYPLLEFKNVNSFNKKGGLNYVNEFYKKRAKRYSISENIGFRGMYLLVRLAIRENDYPTFDLLMNEFKGSGFIENLRSWQSNTCAELYLKHNKPDKAIDLFNIIVKNNPENARVFNGLGKAYLEKGERKKAIQFHKKAIEIAKKNKDRNLDNYKADLDKVRK